MSAYENYLIYDRPIPYKGLNIYPVKMIDYLDFFYALNCLTIEKNKIPNPDIIRMSYLDFLFYLMQNDESGKYVLKMMLRLFELCLHIEPNNVQYFYDDLGKVKLTLNVPFIYKNESGEEVCEMQSIDCDKTDFDEIKKIIITQNVPDYDDTYIDPKVEAVLKEAKEFMNRHKGKTASLEDQIICVLISTSLKEDDIFNLTIRKFAKILQRVDHKMHYEIYKQAEVGGTVTFKEGLDHWMSEIKPKKYADVIMNEEQYSQLKSKIEN